MGKYVNASHITGDRGVIKFKEYCNRHNPYIIFREIKEHDYGIDGEIELVKFEKEKMIASGQILKIQLKSTASSNSYIKKQTESGFTYYASQEDFEYWAAHNLGVILVIYDCNSDRLFAKKITAEDYAYHKKHTKTNSYPVSFTHADTELFVGEGSFFKKVNESYFKPRFDEQIKERLFSNIQFFSSFPRLMYVFDSQFKTKKEIYAQLDEGMKIPPFAIYNKKIYCFQNIPSFHKTFREKIILRNGVNPEIKNWEEIYDDKSILNHYVEVLNQYIRLFLSGERKLWLNRKNKYHYFFPKPSGKDSLRIQYKTRKRESEGARTVVNYYEYGKDHFFRHAGLVYNIDFINNTPVFILNYKYHFTLDGSNPLSPLKITKYTNKLNSREFNDQVLNSLYFWNEFLSGGGYLIEVSDLDDCKIKIKPMEEVTADFGIYKTKDFLNKKVTPKEQKLDQSTLF